MNSLQPRPGRTRIVDTTITKIGETTTVGRHAAGHLLDTKWVPQVGQQRILMEQREKIGLGLTTTVPIHRVDAEVAEAVEDSEEG